MSDFSQLPEQRDFHCPNCKGRIVIPYSLPATTGPCPICQANITSPPPPELPQQPAQAVAPAPVPTNPAPAPVPVQQPVAEAPPTQAPPVQTPAPTEPTTIPPKREPARREKAPAVVVEDDEFGDSGTVPKKSPIVLAIMGLFALVLLAGAAVFFLTKKQGDAPIPPGIGGSENEDVDIREANYLRVGWQKDAYEILEKFIAGKSVEEKLPYIIRPDELKERMELFYGGVTINDSDTPANSFSVQELSLDDRKRGMFMLTYDQPPQFALKDFFRPLASLEVQYGIDQADLLLSTFARADNFAMEPVRAHAFFKRTENGLKLDWETFAQTKYRLLQSFVELPDPGATETFRVLIVEDVPEKGQGVVGARTYRISDPANIADSARINVKLDSEAGRALSVINWRGTKDNRPQTRTATIEVEWTNDNNRPVLTIKRFICWEFLGLGGEEAPASASN